MSSLIAIGQKHIHFPKTCSFPNSRDLAFPIHSGSHPGFKYAKRTKSSTNGWGGQQKLDAMGSPPRQQGGRLEKEHVSNFFSLNQPVEL
jgi:hypothetical protein